MFKPTSSAQRRAQRLRKTPSFGEQRLWQRLRGRQVDGLKFRRQQPIGNYVVDFVCLERRLIVEVDGGSTLCAPTMTAGVMLGCARKDTACCAYRI